MGFGGIILHGVYAYNCIAHDLLRFLGGSKAENLREIEAKFAGIVRPGDKIAVEVWKVKAHGNGLDEFWWRAVVTNTGKPCLTDGRAIMRVSNQTLE